MTEPQVDISHTTPRYISQHTLISITYNVLLAIQAHDHGPLKCCNVDKRTLWR